MMNQLMKFRLRIACRLVSAGPLCAGHRLDRNSASMFFSWMMVFSIYGSPATQTFF